MLNNPFFNTVLCEIPRLLGQIDRNPLSSTYGSCDRAFWQYRTNDISSMRYQEAALTLSLLYKTAFKGNVYHHDERLLSWANAIIRFACREQHADGSFDEWYLNEGSFVCTAFVSSALAEAVLVLGDKLEGRDTVIVALEKSSAWLVEHSETLVVNQLAGAISALSTISALTENVVYTEDATKKCEALLALQEREGWWSEYGGPDAGYLSLTIDYLSRYADKTKNKRVYEAIERASAFLLHFINPDGTAGGEYMARNTEYLIPSGFFRAASYSPSAREIASRVVGSLKEEKGITPRSLDDRYTCYILYNWVEAGILWSNLELHTTPSQKSSDTYFPDAGLFVRKNDQYQFFTNLKKGGSLRLYAGDSVLIDSGVNVLLAGRVYAGNVIHQDAFSSYDESTATLRTEGTLIRVRAPLLTTGRAVVLKTVQWIFGRIPSLQKLLKKALRIASVIHPGSSSALRYERVIVLETDEITITDIVSTSLSRENFIVGGANIYALVPSSRYVAAGVPSKLLQPQNELFESKGGVTRLTRTFAV